ncbi:hypothetical protein BRD17_06295 [Halobacteriales archaeon SW_7_68_16]|nr:MAG: hypothetical protein BRD17_06295 [Halobacteriales archaeon SW_7_68_16]
MGLLDALRGLFGNRAERGATRDADPDDLFGMSTAYVTMSADLDFEPTGGAALCFAGVDSTDFADTVDEVMSIMAASDRDTGSITERHEDDHGYEWVVLDARNFEDLVSGVHFAADTFIERGYGSRLLAAVFGFERPREGTPAYWIYSFRRGTYYPFAPTEDKNRDAGTEFKLESVLDGELTIEDDKQYWYPLWPSRAGCHPWQ